MRCKTCPGCRVKQNEPVCQVCPGCKKSKGCEEQARLCKYRNLVETLVEASLDVDEAVKDLPVEHEARTNARYCRERRDQEFKDEEASFTNIEELLASHVNQRERLDDFDGEENLGGGASENSARPQTESAKLDHLLSRTQTAQGLQNLLPLPGRWGEIPESGQDDGTRPADTFEVNPLNAFTEAERVALNLPPIGEGWSMSGPRTTETVPGSKGLEGHVPLDIPEDKLDLLEELENDVWLILGRVNGRLVQTGRMTRWNGWIKEVRANIIRLKKYSWKAQERLAPSTAPALGSKDPSPAWTLYRTGFGHTFNCGPRARIWYIQGQECIWHGGYNPFSRQGRCYDKQTSTGSGRQEVSNSPGQEYGQVSTLL